MPKRIESLDGIKIAEVACGPWHTAAVSTSGRLFTWGDGTFGALGEKCLNAFFGYAYEWMWFLKHSNRGAEMCL
jgi:alpha-tubulin suppressor-like RCC1 family protein